MTRDLGPTSMIVLCEERQRSGLISTSYKSEADGPDNGICAHKAKSEAQDIEGAPHCTLEIIKTQLASIFDVENLWQMFINLVIEDALDKVETESLSIDDFDNATLSKKIQVEGYTNSYLMDIITDTRVTRSC